MRHAFENSSSLWVDLSDYEIHVLDSSIALSPFDPDYWAPRLGFPTGQALEAETERLTDAIFARQPMTFDDWCAAIDIINGLISPRDSEWQTVNGSTYLETATALVAITRKVDLTFGGTFMNPAKGPHPERT